MLWLTWHMWILLLLAFAGGVITGWVLHGQSDEAPEPETAPEPAETPSEPEPETPPARLSGPSAEAIALTKVEPAPEPAPPAEPEPEPEPAQAPEPEPAPAPAADDLTAIKGLGPKAAEKLAEAGVVSWAQIAVWSDADIDRFDALINGRGRIRRDDWVGQAKTLSD